MRMRNLTNSNVEPVMAPMLNAVTNWEAPQISPVGPKLTQ